MFTVDYDETTGILRCVHARFLSVEESEQYRRAVESAARRATCEFGSVAMLALADGDFQVQKPEVMEAARKGWESRGPDDRMAVFSSSALLRLQAKRIFSSVDTVEVFASEEDAKAWLIASRPVRGDISA